MWTPGTWGEQMFTDGRFFSLSATRLVGRCEEWPISCIMDARGWTGLYSGKRGMLRAGGMLPQNCRRFGTGMCQIKLKVYDSLLALSVITGVL